MNDRCLCVAIRLVLLPRNAMLLPRFSHFVAFNGEKHQKTPKNKEKKQKNEIKIACYHIFLLTLQKQGLSCRFHNEVKNPSETETF